jgi:hypothetical protein
VRGYGADGARWSEVDDCGLRSDEREDKADGGGFLVRVARRFLPGYCESGSMVKCDPDPAIAEEEVRAKRKALKPEVSRGSCSGEVGQRYALSQPSSQSAPPW